MAFLLYSEDRDGHWHLVQNIKLLPIIADFVSAKWKATRQSTLQWAMSERHITSRAKRLHGLPSGNYFVVIDLKPNANGNVSLYRVQNVWGVTIRTWTPIALRLQGLFVDQTRVNPARFKQGFRPPAETKRENGIHEFSLLRARRRDSRFLALGQVRRRERRASVAGRLQLSRGTDSERSEKHMRKWSRIRIRPPRAQVESE